MDKKRLLYWIVGFTIVYAFWPILKGFVLIILLGAATYYVFSGKKKGPAIYTPKNQRTNSKVIDAEFKKKETK